MVEMFMMRSVWENGRNVYDEKCENENGRNVYDEKIFFLYLYFR
jgi:hypothetical protein